MTFVDEMTELIGCAEAASGRVIICDLVTPGTFERMLGDRQQFNMRVTHLQHVRQQRVGQFEIAQLAVALRWFTSPRTEVHLINADRAFRPIASAPRFHPLDVAPFVAVKIVNERRGRYAVLIEEGERIALEQKRAGLGADFEFVMGALPYSWQK